MGDSEEYTHEGPQVDGVAAEPEEIPAPPVPDDDPSVTAQIAAIQQELLLEEAATPDEPVELEPAEPVTAEQADEADEAAATTEPSADVPAVDSAVEAAADEAPADEVSPAEPVTDDDLAAALAAANESVGDAEIIPPAAIPVDPAAAPAPAAAYEAIGTDADVPAARYGAPWWPYFIYALLWIAIAGVGVWQFRMLPAGAPVYEAMFYRLFLFAGLVLSAMGPVLVLGVWLACRESEHRQRKGLFTSALLKGAFFTLLGVMVWWGTLLAVDFMRFGRLL